MPDDTAYTGIGARKTHRKSRFGCGNCKRRRIKCDESKPACNNCTKHSVKCDFIQSTPVSRSTPSSPGQGGRSIPTEKFSRSTQNQSHYGSDSPGSFSQCDGEPEEWGLMSLKLLHNYTTSTCYTFADHPILQDFFRVSAPEIGFSYPFVLHMALATSALHLSRFDQAKETLYKAEADRRYSIALRAATSLMSQVSSENCHALFLFTNLCCIFTLARGPQPGDFLLFGDHGIAEWLIFFRGLKPIIGMHMDILSEGVLAPIFQLGSIAAKRSSPPAPELEQFTHLREFISNNVSNEIESQALSEALDALSPFFTSNPDRDEAMTRSLDFRKLGVWLYLISDEFIALLQQRHPATLVIMAYFCVKLNDCSANWAMKGWTEHMMQGIYRCLGNKHHMWIRWPIEQIGWITD